MKKSNKQKKPSKKLGARLNDIGIFLAGIAAIVEVIFQVVTYLLEK